MRDLLLSLVALDYSSRNRIGIRTRARGKTEESQMSNGKLEFKNKDGEFEELPGLIDINFSGIEKRAKALPINAGKTQSAFASAIASTAITTREAEDALKRFNENFRPKCIIIDDPWPNLAADLEKLKGEVGLLLEEPKAASIESEPVWVNRRKGEGKPRERYCGKHRKGKA